MSTSARVVDYHPTHRSAFERLNLEWIAGWFTVEDSDRQVLEDPEQHILAAGGRILFALDAYGAAIGTVALRHEGNGVYELTKMAVGPDQRGTGVGRTLARAAVDLFDALEGTHLYLETNSRLGPAIALYESIGFEHRPMLPDSHYGRADVHMVWTRREASRVRRASATDAARLASVAAMTFPLACDPTTPPESIDDYIRNNLSVERFEEYLADPARPVFVAERADEIIGYAMLVVGKPSTEIAPWVSGRPTAELSKIYVLPDQHGTGVALTLLSAALEEAGSLGLASLWLSVQAENLRAQTFYRKHGFVPVGAAEFRVGDRVEIDRLFARAVPQGAGPSESEPRH